MPTDKVKTITNFHAVPNKAILLLVLLILPLLTNCSTATKNISTIEAVYSSPPPAALQPILSPSFIIKNPEKDYNLIGTPAVRTSNQAEEIFVDPLQPAIYYESQYFSTKNGSYKNLVYRIHFEKVPFSFSEPHLTAGNNPGILIIYTFSVTDELLLVTTVGTCGCYLAFFPTDNLPAHAYPERWSKIKQNVYGYALPGLLDVSSLTNSAKIIFTLESGSHRISNVMATDPNSFLSGVKHVPLRLLPMSALYNLQYSDKDETTTFFELQGSRKGYVKNNIKILERLLISWWAFDLRVGEDKAYGNDDKSNVPLYTSLKFWQRKASDLKDFPRFLNYWGWNF